MESLYFACDWNIRFADLNVDEALDRVESLNCGLAILSYGNTDEGHHCARLGVKVSSDAVLDEFAGSVAVKYGAVHWGPISENDYAAGKRISVAREERYKIYECVRILLDHNQCGIALHKKLRHEWSHYLIFGADWIIERQGLNLLRELFALATRLESQLVWTHRSKLEGYLALRFFIAVPSNAVFAKLLGQIPQQIGLADWSPVDRVDLPEIVHCNSLPDFSDGAIYNREIHQSKESGTNL